MIDYKLTVTDFSAGVAEVYNFRFGRSGWAIVLVDEATGTIAIHSDYGDWAFSWPSPGRGKGTLKQFICYPGSYDYMASKFMQGTKEEFDYEKTVADVKKLASEKCNLADEEEIVSWLEDGDGSDSCMSVEMFYERMPSCLHELIDPTEFFSYRKPHEYYWLRDGILPAIVSELRKLEPQVAA